MDWKKIYVVRKILISYSFKNKKVFLECSDIKTLRKSQLEYIVR